MGEITVKETKQQPTRRMPWWGKLLIVLGVIFVLIPLITVGAFYACFYDSTHNPADVKDNYPTSQVLEGVIVHSLDKTTTTKKMSLQVKDKHLNQVLYNAFNSNATLKEYIPNSYVVAKDGKYTFYVEVNGKGFFRTRVILSTQSVITEDLITFKVNDIQIGRVGGFNKLTGLVSQFVSSQTITEALQTSGLKLNFSLEKLEITYAMSDFQNDLKKLLKFPSEYNALFDELIGQKDFRTITATEDNLFALDVNLSKLQLTSATHGIENYTVKDGYYNAFISDLEGDIAGLLNKSKIEAKDVNIVTKFLLGGEAILNGTEQTVIDNYKAENAFAGVTHATTPYYDFTTDVANELKTKIQSQITESAVAQMIAVGTPINVNLTTSDLDLMFSTSTAFSQFYVFTVDEPTAEAPVHYEENYIVLDRASTILNNNKLYFAINVNFSGEPTQITLESTKKDDSNFATMKFDINRILIGDTEVGQSSKSAFLSTINSALGNDAFNGVFTINQQEITFNLSSILAEKMVNSTNAVVDFSLANSSSSSDGQINITLNRKL